jgi:hypothetical protein
MHGRPFFKNLIFSTLPKRPNNGKLFHPDKYFKIMMHTIYPIAEYISNDIGG